MVDELKFVRSERWLSMRFWSIRKLYRSFGSRPHVVTET